VTIGQLIHEFAGGMRPGRKLKAVIPGGSSAKILKAGEVPPEGQAGRRP